MPDFAISDGSKIVNVIVSDSKEIAEEITGLSAIESDGQIGIGWTLEEDGWRSPSPFPSWTWVDGNWTPPNPMPEKNGFYFLWNEEKLDWDEHEIPSPYPSWVKDNDGEWVAPIPVPNNEDDWLWDEDTTSWILQEENTIGENI